MKRSFTLPVFRRVKDLETKGVLKDSKIASYKTEIASFKGHVLTLRLSLKEYRQAYQHLQCSFFSIDVFNSGGPLSEAKEGAKLLCVCATCAGLSMQERKEKKEKRNHISVQT